MRRMTRKALNGHDAGFKDAVDQMAAYLANLKSRANICVYCGDPFMVGSRDKSKGIVRGRRKDAIYCCNAHRVADQRRKARQARQARQEQGEQGERGARDALPAKPNPPILARTL